MSESDARNQGTNAPEGIVLGPGEGRTIGGITLKATGDQTGGSIGFIEAMSPPGYGPPRHVHYGCDELFYVLEGQFLFLVGERQVSGPPGIRRPEPLSRGGRGGACSPRRGRRR